MSSPSPGIMFRVSGDLFFLPASIALKVIPMPEMANVPGAPEELRGISLVDGEMIAVIDLSTLLEDDDEMGGGAMLADGAMLVCNVLGEHIGLVGLNVVATGRFQVDPTSGEMLHHEEAARLLDVASVISRVREGRWAV